jgi:hypothetical protein
MSAQITLFHFFIIKRVLGVANLNSLTLITGNIAFSAGYSGELNMPALKSVGGNVGYTSTGATKLSVNLLQKAGDIAINNGNPAFSATLLTTCSSLTINNVYTETFVLPSLTAVKGNLFISRVTVKSWSFPSLASVAGSLTLRDSIPATDGAFLIDFSKLQNVQGTLTLTGNANPYTVPAQTPYNQNSNTPCYYQSNGQYCTGTCITIIHYLKF